MSVNLETVLAIRDTLRGAYYPARIDMSGWDINESNDPDSSMQAHTSGWLSEGQYCDFEFAVDPSTRYRLFFEESVLVLVNPEGKYVNIDHLLETGKVQLLPDK